MRRSTKVLPRLAGVCAAIALLAGCGGTSQIALPGAGAPSAANAIPGAPRAPMTGAARTSALKRHRTAGWMDPQAKKDRLMYASDFNNSVVEVYAYPKGKHVGTLTTGLLNPQGSCVDKTGNVYVANTGDNNVLEYAHGGTKPIRVLNDPGEYPVGCSVNDRTGDVAAADIFSPTTGIGAVTVWPRGSVEGTTYVEPGGLTECLDPAYDGSGNLYVNGTNSGEFALAYLPAGSSTWRTATIPDVGAGAMQWDGHYMAVVVQTQPQIVDQVSFHRGVGTVVGSTTLDGPGGGLFIFGEGVRKKLASLDGGSAQVGVYHYPAGGSPIRTIRLSMLKSYPSLNGLVISNKP